ncbi:MAG: tetratricopeptide repeat protein [Alphaproteobacteria bacterium]|nr:tetratricopeptide repeat protein [Alphaproteobacteria bacterium]MDE2162342.1 tetratricopeptide repeat protein [Alphaproteobacteria bacterium]
MFKWLTLFLALVVLRISPAYADQAARPTGSIDKPGWTEFDGLVAYAKKTMMADPKSALDKARGATAFAQRQPVSPGQQQALATALWLEAEALTRVNQVPQARVAVVQAIKIASSDGKITKLDGDLALTRARVADNDGDVELALKSYQKAYDIFVKIGQPRGQSMALQGLGSIYEEAHDLPREIYYYKEAAQVYSAEPVMQLTIANYVGFALHQAGRYEEALTEFRRALTIAIALKSPYLEARILTNIADTYAKLHNLSAAQSAANQALKLLGNDDKFGWTPFAWGIKAEIEFDRGALARATDDLAKAFRGVDLTKTIAPFRDMHEIAYKVYRATGNYPLALAHLEALKRLDDEGHSLTASANLALMSARFDFANQKLQIEHLKTEQLQRDASLRASRFATLGVVLLSLILVAVLIIIWISWRHRLLGEHRDAISKANTELTRTLGERDLEIERRIETECRLRDAKEAAEQASGAKTKFLATMSHELRTPLNAIIGFADIISLGVVAPAKAQEYSADISAGGRRLLAILSDILDTTNLEAGKISLSEDELVLGEIIEGALANIGNQVAGKQLSVIGDRGSRVRGDAERLVQIVQNLVSNAAKFTAPGGRIEIGLACAKDGGVDVTICDDGIGIPAEQLERIVEPFGQVAGVYARAQGGAGLGLAIVKSLVALHGGTLTITSEPAKGTSVLVHLPAARVLPQRAEPAPVEAQG